VNHVEKADGRGNERRRWMQMSGNREANEKEMHRRDKTTPVDVSGCLCAIENNLWDSKGMCEQNILLLPYEYRERQKQRTQSRNGRREREGRKLEGVL
jgi:hypothetical protein